MRQKGIAIAGNIIADIAYMIDVYPQKGNLTRIDHPTPHTGGMNNLMIDLARMDSELPIKASGLVGDDENGRFIIEILQGYPNINTENIIVGGRTAVTYAMTEKESKQRTFFYDPGSSLSYNEEQINFNKLDADIFHLEYLLVLGTLDEEDPEYGTKAAKVLAEARRRGMETSIDMVSEEGKRYQKIVVPALKYTDYLIVNEVEGSGVTGIQMYDAQGVIEDRVWEGLEKMRSLGVAKWAVIHSPFCGYGLDCKTGERVRIQSFQLPSGFIKGTTGAGDAFCAGVLYAAYKDQGLSEALRLGALTAACSLSEEDSNSGVLSVKELEESMRQKIEKITED